MLFMYDKVIQKRHQKLGFVMNLRAAQKELGSRSPHVAFPVLALEALVVISLSIILVGVFA